MIARVKALPSKYLPFGKERRAISANYKPLTYIGKATKKSEQTRLSFLWSERRWLSLRGNRKAAGGRTGFPIFRLQKSDSLAHDFLQSLHCLKSDK